ncbi:hypothetical protein B0919_17090 [Hymenobacter sp. CRA2]|nr:hypothetical protein B0919_17090 [Hymenobacter sp. CRA2]
MTVSLAAEATAAYNIVWLRATIVNNTGKSVKLLNPMDTVETACPRAASFVLQVLTPSQDTAVFCRRCNEDLAPNRTQKLRPGQQWTTHLQVDLNRVLPRAVADTMRNCRQYNNRTLGAYRFYLSHNFGVTNGPPRASNMVTVYRKK